MMTGYVLVQCEVGKELEVSKLILKKYPKEVSEVMLCFGEYELWLRVTTRNYVDFVSFVSHRLRKEIAGIVATKTAPGKHRVYLNPEGEAIREDCA